jgi:hypothetical protein
MEVLGTAVGVASLGIQVCQGLLAYYNTWKTYDSDINDTYTSVADLSSTLTILQTALNDDTLDEERSDRVESCLQSCVQALVTLSTEAQKLKKVAQPVGSKQKITWGAQRLQYPFQAKTLAKFKIAVGDMQGRLQVALQVLQLETTQQARKALVSIEQSGQEQNRVLVSLEKANQEQKKVLASLEQSGEDHKTVLKSLERSGQKQKFEEWLNPADPWTNHASARKHHESGTGDWLLRSSAYQSWKTGATKHIWLFGKAGCGKTIISSTLIEDVQAYCTGKDDSCLGVFYFTFSDQRKQTYDDLLRSLAVQLGMKGPGLPVLQQAYNTSNRGRPAVTGLEEIIVASVHSYSNVFVMLDALDECPEEQDARYYMLQGLRFLAGKIPALKLCVTSREIRDVREAMTTIVVTPISIETSAVDADIERYISKQLLSDTRLTRLNEDTKKLILRKLSSRADGMWVQLQD